MSYNAQSLPPCYFDMTKGGEKTFIVLPVLSLYVTTLLFILSLSLFIISFLWLKHCSNTLSSLVEESGCPLEHPKAASFRSHVISGEWDEVS